jgi:hypothetical protein
MRFFAGPIAVAVTAAFALALPVAAKQQFVTGVFTATEAGPPLELIAWADARAGKLRLSHGFLEDAPILPRTYRFLVNVPFYDVVGVLAVNKDVFSQPLDRLESRMLPHTTVKLNVQTVEIGVPELEDWEKVLRLRKSLKATNDKPLVLFLVLTNGIVNRFYPFFIDR